MMYDTMSSRMQEQEHELITASTRWSEARDAVRELPLNDIREAPRAIAITSYVSR